MKTQTKVNDIKETTVAVERAICSGPNNSLCWSEISTEIPLIQMRLDLPPKQLLESYPPHYPGIIVFKTLLFNPRHARNVFATGTLPSDLIHETNEELTKT